ncbi:MAG: DUF2971 domain-containing protein [Flavipsychrobacter sp.]|nr:DUF2971 domain-containing protein [Flavipsychrobacter sp.]
MSENVIKTSEKLIFKYLPINVYTLQTIVNNELHFTSPQDFNDPRDSKFKLKVSAEIDGVINFYNSLNLSSEEKAKKISRYYLDNKEFFNDIETEFNTRLKKETGVTCFSERNDNALMWSHYADKHTGICLMFEWEKHASFFMGYKVQYKNTIPEVYYSGNGLFETGNIILTKLAHWSYEQEVRSVIKLDNGTNHLAAFDPKALKGIIYGERASKVDKKTIRKIINMHPGYENVEFFTQSVNESNGIIIKKIT